MKIHWKYLTLLALTILQGTTLTAQESEEAINKQVKEILGKLTLEEKVTLTNGSFRTGGIPRLGIGQLNAMDGPVGVRLPPGMNKKSKKNEGGEVLSDTASSKGFPERTSALPATLLLAATWDRQSAYNYSSVIADEMLAINRHILFGPGMNMMRDPRGGRSYEYLGEDPYLTAEMAISYVRGLQDKKVAANLKHYVANEMDTLRHFTSSRVDEQTLREVYVYPFERAIREANAWSLMTGNNLVNDRFVSEDDVVLKQILREQIGFKGVILTDWRAAYNAKPSVQATLDMTTGICNYVYGKNLRGLVESGEVPMKALDEMVSRILTVYVRTGVVNPASRGKGAVDTPEHRARIRKITSDGMVLLKNTNQLLPLAKPASVIVTGPGSKNVDMGGGSGLVNGGVGNRTILEGLTDAYGQGVVVEKAANELLSGNDLKLAAAVIYCANAPRGSESMDLKEITLSEEQIAEIKRLGALTDRLVIVLQTGSAVDMTAWGDAASAVLVAWYGGQAAGDAVADLLTGKANPSGRMPCTFGNAISDYPVARLDGWPPKQVHAEAFTKAGFKEAERALAYSHAPVFFTDYKEKGLIGHAWFEVKGIKPVYAFGYGLSYTAFEIGDMAIKEGNGGWTVTCSVKNTGKQAGADVVQLYAKGPEAAAARKLRGFEKVTLNPGEIKQVVLQLKGSDLASFDVGSKKWKTATGVYTIELTDRDCTAPQLKSEITLEKELAFAHP